jgi:hypothetical protein
MQQVPTAIVGMLVHTSRVSSERTAILLVVTARWWDCSHDCVADISMLTNQSHLKFAARPQQMADVVKRIMRSRRVGLGPTPTGNQSGKGYAL